MDNTPALEEHVRALESMARHLKAVTAIDLDPEVIAILTLILRELDDVLRLLRGTAP